MKAVIIIPSRLASQRLAQKPLASINGKPMVLWVYEQAVASKIGSVVVACCSEEIAKIIKNAGGKAVLTNPDLPSGTDRVWAAYESLGESFDAIINLQGDLPIIAPSSLKDVLDPLAHGYSMGTIACPITNEEEITNPNVVKIALGDSQNSGVAPGVYFSRQAIPHNAPIYYHHIGVYSYTPETLKKFVSLQPTTLEKTERLEQLRILENGVPIGVKLVDKIPTSVDTLEDLERVRQEVQHS